MEHFFLSGDEFKWVRRKRIGLENKFKVKITLPDIENDDISTKDVICACVWGESSSMNNLKKCITSGVERLQAKCAIARALVNNVPMMMTLIDEEGRTAAHPKKKVKKKKGKSTKTQHSTLSPTLLSSTLGDESICQVNIEPEAKRLKLDASVIIVEENNSTATSSQSPNDDDSIIVLTPDQSANEECIVIGDGPDPPSLTANDECIVIGEGPDPPSSNHNKSIICLNEDFLPLRTANHSTKRRKGKNAKGKSVIQPSIPKLITNKRRNLRPIVIDGSNVAREHGKTTYSFSWQGIKISIDYFLARGHTDVTAFVPLFLKHRTHGYADHDIIINNSIKESLYRAGHLVFTPSRRLPNGKNISSYDDRFIVELATQKGGVILSNDNFRDILVESEAFKFTIENRLLMFCFAGDTLMCPNDPMGRNGLTLDEFLSFPDE